MYPSYVCAYVPVCPSCVCTYVPVCPFCVCTYVPVCPSCVCTYVPVCPSCVCTYVPVCPSCVCTYVPVCPSCVYVRMHTVCKYQPKYGLCRQVVFIYLYIGSPVTTYCSHKDPSYVDYKGFSNEMEAKFMEPGVEMTTVDPQPYSPTLNMEANTLLP